LCGYANIQKSLDAAPFSAAFSRSNCSTYDCEFVALAQAKWSSIVDCQPPNPARISRGRHFVEEIRAGLDSVEDLNACSRRPAGDARKTDFTPVAYSSHSEASTALCGIAVSLKTFAETKPSRDSTEQIEPINCNIGSNM
jgi:hypothetical protein